ncbi:hypothetical protein D3C78_1836600 [compost metagenome]
MWLGAGVGLISSFAFGFYGLARLGHMAELSGPLGRLSGKSRKLMTKFGVWRD